MWKNPKNKLFKWFSKKKKEEEAKAAAVVCFLEGNILLHDCGSSHICDCCVDANLQPILHKLHTQLHQHRITGWQQPVSSLLSSNRVWGTKKKKKYKFKVLMQPSNSSDCDVFDLSVEWGVKNIWIMDALHTRD